MIVGAIPYPGFVGASYRAQSHSASQERTVNLFPQMIKTAGGKNNAILLPTPGFTPWVTLPKSPVRGLYYENGRLFAGAGDRLYEVYANQTYVERGTVLYSDANPLSWGRHDINGGELVVGASGNAYRLDLVTNAWSTVLTGGVTQVGFLGSYFVALLAGSNLYRWSDLFDATTWPGDFVFQRSNRSDPWRSMAVIDERLFLFGERTSDVHWAGGAYPSVFQPLPGGTLGVGTGAPYSVVDFNGNAVWLASAGDGKGQVMMAQGLSPQSISHHALQFAIENYPRVDDAIGSTYEMEGHTFYLLTFPSARITWAWDATIPGMWCERGTWIHEENDFDYWHPTYQQYAFGMHLAGSRESNVIYRMSPDLYLDVDERPIRRVRRAPALTQLGQMVHYTYFALEGDPGVAPLGVDPLVELRISDNGGKTFQSVGWRSFGKQGEFDKPLAEWHGLGMSADRVFEAVMAAASPYRLTNAYLGTGPV
jgi:hypothetical protein